MLGYKTIEEFTLADCEEFLKRTDISDEEHQRALRQRMRLLAAAPELSQTNHHDPPKQAPAKSVIEEFPEYDFVPTTLLSVKNKVRLFYVWSVIILGFLTTVAGIIVLCLWNYWWPRETAPAVGFPLLGGGLIILFLGIYYKKRSPIKKVADYIAGKTKVGRQKKRIIFVKDRKFGVLKKGSNKILVPAEYDKLAWHGKKVLDVEKNGRKFMIDIYGNELT